LDPSSWTNHYLENIIFLLLGLVEFIFGSQQLDLTLLEKLIYIFTAGTGRIYLWIPAVGLNIIQKI
jgi:hypothetical protein